MIQNGGPVETLKTRYVRIIKILFSILLLGLLSFTLVGYISHGKKDNFPVLVKIALRDSGNQLLLADHDSTSLVLPIVELDQNRFELSFQRPLSIMPDSLVNTLSKSFQVSNLPKDYIVEVIDCDSKQVAYSYQISQNVEKNLIPCIGRKLPSNCYKVHVLFTDQKTGLSSYKTYSLLSFVLIGFLGLGLFHHKKEKGKGLAQEVPHYSKIGAYTFYEHQNTLVKDNLTIQLTSKECELLKILNKNQNKVVKRDLLIKEVWEDNGVFVGRSLDTFISKIRKKLKRDDTIKIVNVHGVGYKLEVS
jgi:hypothetical protein